MGWEGRFDQWRGRVRAYRSEIDITNTASNGVAPTGAALGRSRFC